MSDKKTVKRLWIGIGILILLSPLGIIIPALFHAGGAWGEWSIEEIKGLTGYIPEGMRKLAGLWKSPMPGYTVPGQKEGVAHQSLGYVLTALVGVLVTAGLGYLFAKMVAKKNKSE